MKRKARQDRAGARKQLDTDMSGLIVQALIVCALAIAAWWITDRFSPDALLTKLVKLAIFIAVLIWVIVKLLPRVM